MEEIKNIKPEVKTLKWSQEGNKLYFQINDIKVHWVMPNDWDLKDVHPTILKLLESILISPFFKYGSGDAEVATWEQRTGGENIGLAFNGKEDSVLAMMLLPKDTILYYHQRKSTTKCLLNQTNALNLIKSLDKKVYKIRSTNEDIRTGFRGKPGFSTDFACATGLILMADYLDLGYISMSTMLASGAYEFEKRWYWEHWKNLFAQAGLQLVLPLIGLSSVINNRIIRKSKYKNLAHSCLRADFGKDCGRCLDCLKKSLLNDKGIDLTPTMYRGLEKLKKSGCNNTDSLIYAYQSNKNKIKNLKEYKNKTPLEKYRSAKTDFMERYYSPSLDLLPNKFRKDVKDKLEKFGIEPMTERDIKKMKRLKSWE